MLLELFFKFFIYSEFVDDCGIETEYEYGRGGGHGNGHIISYVNGKEF